LLIYRGVKLISSTAYRSKKVIHIQLRMIELWVKVQLGFGTGVYCKAAAERLNVYYYEDKAHLQCLCSEAFLIPFKSLFTQSI
jgi:hypothetical protein